MTNRAVGIDTSKWDQYFHPSKAFETLDFAILRLGYALTIDRIFFESAAACKSEKIYWMIYFYMSTAVSWRSQAEFILETIAKTGACPYAYWIDFETSYNHMSLDFARDCGDLMKYLQSKVKVPVGLYTNVYLYDYYISKTGSWHHQFPLWIAWLYAGDASNPGMQPLLPSSRLQDQWTFWQYKWDANGKLYGLGRVQAADLNVFNGTKQDLLKWSGKTDQDVQPPSGKTIKIKTINTDWIHDGNEIQITNQVIYE